MSDYFKAITIVQRSVVSKLNLTRGFTFYLDTRALRDLDSDPADFIKRYHKHHLSIRNLQAFYHFSSYKKRKQWNSFRALDPLLFLVEENISDKLKLLERQF